MILIKDVQQLRTSLQKLDRSQKIALVPTMGNLHDGHLQLVQKAKEAADRVVVSIFVNPLQFGPNEDFSVYPRTLEADIEKLTELDIEFVFAPSSHEMYPKTTLHTQVCVPKISDEYCGSFRPSFFYGVATVVTKLFNLVQPDAAIFGEKDFQQLHIIKKLVHDLSFPLEIISVPTVRELDGLAMSSRNQYLTPIERTRASEIFKTLCKIRDQLRGGERNYDQITNDAAIYLQEYDFKVDYLHICHRHTLEKASAKDPELVILIAAWLGKTRLIDNLTVCLV